MQDSMPSPFEFNGTSGVSAAKKKKADNSPFTKNIGRDEPDEDKVAESSRLASEDDVVRVFDNKGPLSEKEGYRIRPGQVRMACDVLDAIYDGHNLVVEAGTGAGKTFAYLVPILLSGRKALISTYSKALQDQLYDKDIKFLKQVLDIDVSISILKGASNYLCKKNMSRVFGVPEPRGEQGNGQSGQEAVPVLPAPGTGVGIQTELLMGDAGGSPALNTESINRNRKIITAIKNYIICAKTGEIEEFKNHMQATAGIEASELNIGRIGVNKINCSKKKCPFYEECYLVNARKRAKNSRIVILNQSLLCYGVQNDEMLFPKVGIVVVDEAHKFEDTLRDAFSAEIGTESINEAITAVYLTKAYEKIKNDIASTEKRIKKPNVESKKTEPAKGSAGTSGLSDEEERRLRYQRVILQEIDKVLADLRHFAEGRSADSFPSFIDNIYTDNECCLLPQYEKMSYRISTCASSKSRNSAAVQQASEEAVLLDLNLDKFIKGLHLFGEKVGAVYMKLTGLSDAVRILYSEANGSSEIKDGIDELEEVTKVFTDTYDFIGNTIQYLNTCKSSGMMASSYYYWYRKVSGGGFSITRSPFRPSVEFKNFFLTKEDCFNSFIFASATIDTGGVKSPAIDLLVPDESARETSGEKDETSQVVKETDFRNFRFGIGLSSDNTVCKLVYSPFDFKNNAILCVPEELSSFTSNYDDSLSTNLVYASPTNILKMLAPVINATRGGVFILVTSYDACRRYADALRKNQVMTLGFDRTRKVFEQEKNVSNNNHLIRRFKEAGDAILIGTKSFWEGVDIPGSALSLVIIDKIPFPQKTVHRFMTRMMYESEGLNAFDRVDVTSAIIDLKQGAGRLIRTEKDKGAVIICSRDLLNSANKSYAGRILNSLSYFNMTNRIDVVRDLIENDFRK
ncbi:MAG: ATP-dependent DNA helicase [Ruminobacter sp.]|nr:ATP-dependent DNA helicase [Ruminobacter sp.]